MRIDNINGVLPQKVSKPGLAEKMASSAINNVSGKYRGLAKSIIDSIFLRITDLETYQDETAVKQIDLILGRIEDLLDQELETFSTQQKEFLKTELVEEIKAQTGISSDLRAEFENFIKLLLNESIDALKNDLITMFKRSTDQSNDTSDTSTTNDTNVNNQTDVNQQNSNQEETEEEKENYKKELDEEYQKRKNDLQEDYDERKEDVKKSNTPTTESQPNQNEQTDNQQTNQDKNKDKNKSKDKKGKNKNEINPNELKKFITKALDQLRMNLVNTMGVLINGGAVNSIGKKKRKDPNETKLNKIIKVLDKMSKQLNNISEYFINLEERILIFFEKNVNRIAKVISKAVFIIALPLVALFWLTVGPVLTLIAYGIFLIIKAIAENMPLFVDGINKTLAVIAEAIPILASAVPKFFDVLLKILDIIIKILDFAITELWPFIKNELWPFIRDEIWPFIKDFVKWLKDEVYEPVIKPILVWLATSFLSFVERVIFPLVEKVLNWTLDVLLPWVTEHILPVLETILSLLNTFLKALEPWIKPLVDIVLSTFVELFTIIKPVLIELAKFLADVFMGIIKAIKATWDFVSKNILSPLWDFIGKIADFGGWIWSKIAAILPWGGDSDSVDKKVNEANTHEELKAENARLRKILEELGGGDIVEAQKAAEEQKKQLEEARKEVLEIDKGSVYDVIKLMEQIDFNVRDVLMKLLATLTSLCNFLADPENPVKQEIKALNELSNQETTIKQGIETSNEVAEFDKTLNDAMTGPVPEMTNPDVDTTEIANQTIANNFNTLTEVSTNVGSQPHKLELDINETNQNIKKESETKQKAYKNKSEEIMDFLKEQFGAVMNKLDEPIETKEQPIALINTGLNSENPALDNDSFGLINSRIIKTFF